MPVAQREYGVARMNFHEFLMSAVVLLAVLVISTQVFSRLGFGAVLGMLAAGLLLGPWGINLAHDVEKVRSFTELGVVFLMFNIGLEMDVRRLFKMRKLVFGFGTLQVLITGVLVGLLLWSLGSHWQIALLGGLGLALSSTAIGMKILSERKELEKPHGEAAFAVLLLQDLAVVPLLALVPLLTGGSAQGSGTTWTQLVDVCAALVAVFAAGRWILPFLLHRAIRFRNDTGFAALILLAILGAALVMEWCGLSMALGAFLLGLQISDEEIMHRIEGVAKPAMEVLLALFFVAVGMSINVKVFVENWPLVIACVLAFMAIKIAVFYFLSRRFGVSHAGAIRIAFVLSQAGEFGFVLSSAIHNSGLEPRDSYDAALLMIAISMAFTPVLAKLSERWTPRNEPPLQV